MSSSCDPLPDGCSWQVHKLSGVGQTALFFRVSHTVADAVLALAIVNTVFEDEDVAPPAAAGERRRRRRRPALRASALIGGLWSTMTLPCMRGDDTDQAWASEWRRRAELRSSEASSHRERPSGLLSP